MRSESGMTNSTHIVIPGPDQESSYMQEAKSNAKKYIETGKFGGKGSDAHKAGVVGDTVGDPFKDTSGPSLNILIKLMSMVSVVIAGLVVRYSLTALEIF